MVVRKAVPLDFAMNSDEMDKVIDAVVKPEGGWDGDATGTFSEPFSTREVGRKAAQHAVCERAPRRSVW